MTPTFWTAWAASTVLAVGEARVVINPPIRYGVLSGQCFLTRPPRHTSSRAYLIPRLSTKTRM